MVKLNREDVIFCINVAQLVISATGLSLSILLFLRVAKGVGEIAGMTRDVKKSSQFISSELMKIASPKNNISLHNLYM